MLDLHLHPTVLIFLKGRFLKGGLICHKAPIFLMLVDAMKSAFKKLCNLTFPQPASVNLFLYTSSTLGSISLSNFSTLISKSMI